jgi:hypothetical protein
LFGGDEVVYLFDMDFTKNTYSSSNSAGTWYYFYGNQIGGGIVYSTLGGLSRKGTYQPFNAYYNSGNRIGSVSDGTGVEVRSSSYVTASWAVNDWKVGDTLQFTDGIYLPEGNGAVYTHGNVILESIALVSEKLPSLTTERLTIETLSLNQYAIHLYYAIPGATYIIQQSTNLNDWIDSGSKVAAGTTVSWVMNSTSFRIFYRIRLE